MQTLQQRVERLERSCRRWRGGCVLICIAALAAAAINPDAQFRHLTVQSLTVRNQPGGPVISISCDNDQASMHLSSPAAAAGVSLVAAKDLASVFVSRNGRAITSATLSADDQSGAVDIRSADGKSRDIEPQ